MPLAPDLLTHGIPTPGQLVTVRQRRYQVAHVAPSHAPPELSPEGAILRAQHLIRLEPIDDDTRGGDLTVVWEIEPGTQVFERASLPDPTRGFDEARRLDAFLAAVRWAAVASADIRTLHAPFRSGITIEDYQLDPVARALSMPRVSLLVADDVGLGKTIEAGLVVQELLLRNRARTALVVCPAGLQIQWRDQLRDKFGLEFRIIDSAALRELRRRRGLHGNPFTHFPRLITSIDFLKRERPMRMMRDALPPEGQPAFPRAFDLLLVDEAHNVAPSGRGHYAVDSLRTQAIRAIAPHFEHKLFLSATPHNGYTESFAALLELLDDQRFHRGVKPDPAQLQAVMVRRLKSELPPDDLGRPRFPPRELTALEVDFPEAEEKAHALFHAYTTLRQKGARDEAETFVTEFVLKLLKKRLFSSPEAFRLTLDKHRKTLRADRADGERRPGARPSMGILRREIDGIEEDTDDDAAWEERAESALETAAAAERPPSPEETRLLDELSRWAEQAASRPDAKAKALLAWLEALVRPGGAWGETRVIVFTEYRATQKWLEGLLASRGLTEGKRLLTLYGGMDPEERERVKAAFQASPNDAKVRILLATDAASEGIDLQNHCSRLLHYEIPWNPNRMEQRSGRVDRHGQRAPRVEICHFVGKGWGKHQGTRDTDPGSLEGDLEFLFRAARKVDQIREDLGNVGDVIQRQIEEAMLGRRRSFDPDRSAPRAAAAKAALRVERKLREQLERLHDKLKESRKDLGICPATLAEVVAVGLELSGNPRLTPVTIPLEQGRTATAYRMPPLGGTWAACGEGLAHPHTGAIRPLVFDDQIAKDRDDVVYAHLGHRLVQMCLGLLRAEVWAPEGQRKLHRVSARLVPARALENPVLVAHARLVVTGATNDKLHEEVITAGGALRQGRFARLGASAIDEALRAASAEGNTDAPPEVRETLAALFPAHESAVLAALEARMKDRMGGLTRALEERGDKEARDLAEVMNELQQTILRELDATPPAQLTLFTSEERSQLERNRDALSARAAAIPAEIARETEVLRARFQDPKARLFPVALTYLIPKSMVR
jgi:superfamily II DNA or RNA helicase